MLESIKNEKRSFTTSQGRETYYSYISHSRDAHAYQNTTILPLSKPLKYEYKGLSLILPHELFSMVECFEKSEYILNLLDNWDDEGSESYSLKTWCSAVSFVASYALEVYKKENRIIDTPRIFPSMKGSIDIDWETPQYGWLVNIEKGGTKASYFADNLQNKEEIESEFVVKDFKFYESPLSKLFPNNA